MCPEGGHCDTRPPGLSRSVKILIHSGYYPQQIATQGQPVTLWVQGPHLREPQHPRRA